MKTHRLCVVLLIAFAIGLAGCAGPAKRNALLYKSARVADVALAQADALAESNATAARASGFAALASKCGSDDCISALANQQVLGEAIAALKAAAKPARNNTPVPYERDTAAKARDWLGGITPIATHGINAWGNARASDNATQIALGDQATTRGIVESTVGASRDIAVAAVEHAQPVTNYNVGGDFTGHDRTETNVGDGYTAGDRTEITTTTTAGRDQIGGDRIDNTGVIGDGNETRIGSDGPFDDHSCEATEVGCHGSIDLPADPADPIDPVDPVDPVDPGN